SRHHERDDGLHAGDVSPSRAGLGLSGARMHPLAQDLDHILDHTAGLWRELDGAPIFITGGTGFVGIWLLESLAHAADRFNLNLNATVVSRNPQGFAAKAPHLAAHRSLTLLEADACSFPFPAGDFPFVIHAATERSFAATTEYPLS